MVANKTVIVTGASRGIGAAICRQLRVQGIRVIGVARSAEPLKQLAAEKIGQGSMEVVVGDVTDSNVAKQAVDLATRHDGSLEGLVLNAGILGPIDKVASTSAEEFQRCLNVNVVANLAWMQAALPHLRRTRGRIILTSSLVGTTPFGGFSAYCVSKAALNMLASVTAQEEPEVTVLAVEPGVVDTSMASEFRQKGSKFMSSEQAQYMENLKKSGGLGKAEDVAVAYAKLALKAPLSNSGQFISYKASWVKDL